MVDFIRFTVYKPGISKYFRDHICHLHKINEGTGDLIYYNRNYHGFYITLKGDRVTVAGSLHKYFTGGDNYYGFKRSEIKRAVSSLCKKLKLDPEDDQIHITYLEIGINILTEYTPDLYYDALIEYRKNPFIFCQPKRRTTTLWGVKCTCTDYDLKFYDKFMQTKLTLKGKKSEKEAFLSKLERNILRYEIQYRRVKSGTKLSHLYAEEFLIAQKVQLQKKFNLIHTRSLLNSELMSKTELDKYHAAASANYWKDLRKISPGCYKNAKRTFSALVAKYSYKEEPMNEIREKISIVSKLLIDG